MFQAELFFLHYELGFYLIFCEGHLLELVLPWLRSKLSFFGERLVRDGSYCQLLLAFPIVLESVERAFFEHGLLLRFLLVLIQQVLPIHLQEDDET